MSNSIRVNPSPDDPGDSQWQWYDWDDAWKFWNGELPKPVRDMLNALFPTSPWAMGADHRWHVSHNRYDTEDITDLVYDLIRDWWEDGYENE